MKVGVRNVNITNRIKARTTGNVKRKLKRSVNPLYGKKGVGLITDPEKSIYNKVYNRTSVSVDTVADKILNNSDNTSEDQEEDIFTAPGINYPMTKEERISREKALKDKTFNELKNKLLKKYNLKQLNTYRICFIVLGIILLLMSAITIFALFPLAIVTVILTFICFNNASLYKKILADCHKN